MLHKILIQLQEHFNATPKEARGYAVLIILSFFILLLPLFFRLWVIPIVYDPGVIISGMPLINSDSVLTENFTNYSAEHESVISDERVIRLFEFDPNEVTVDQMMDLGIPRFLANRIQNFRSKGGRFRNKEDLLKIYDFPATLYKSLEVYIVIKSTPENINRKNTDRREVGQEKIQSPVKKTQKQGTDRFDLNTADSLQLISIRGIGPVLSSRILKYRQSLGGFHHIEQLKEVYNLDSVAIRELEKNSFIGASVKKLNINQSTQSELLRHPYLRGKRKETGVLLNYIQHHGPLRSESDLFMSRSLDSLTIMKILPYVAF